MAELKPAGCREPAAEPARFTIPDFEKRLAKVLDRFASHPGQALPMLQTIQDEFGYLPLDALKAAAERLGVPGARIWGVATFYNQFRFQPLGKFHVQVCRGTACHVKGSAKVLEAICRYLKVEPGRTTRDKMFSLEVVACMGACALSPVVCVNEDYHAKVSPAKVVQLLDGYRQEAMAAAPQG